MFLFCGGAYVFLFVGDKIARMPFPQQLYNERVNSVEHMPKLGSTVHTYGVFSGFFGHLLSSAPYKYILILQLLSGCIRNQERNSQATKLKTYDVHFVDALYAQSIRIFNFKHVP